MKLAIAKLRLDGGTQPRAELNADVIAEYADAITGGATLPKIVVFFDGTDNWVADGFHRVAAEKKIDHEKIDADVRQGTRRDAVLYSCGANASHGLPRTNADKRRAVTVLITDTVWGGRSARWIAGKACVSPDLVDRMRHELPETGSRTGKDGKTRQPPKPKAKPAASAAEPAAPSPVEPEVSATAAGWAAHDTALKKDLGIEPADDDEEAPESAPRPTAEPVTDEWDEEVAVIEAVDAVARIADAWPADRSLSALVSALRKYADRLERREKRTA